MFPADRKRNVGALVGQEKVAEMALHVLQLRHIHKGSGGASAVVDDKYVAPDNEAIILKMS
jgi:hypothetical protein